MAMKILLQQKKTGLYFKDAGMCTHQSTEAKDFICSTKAIEFCVEHKIYDAQIVLKFEKERYEIVMPMIDERRYSGGDRYARTA